ncbi:hypothetical protein HC028_09210 [Planosporangium flavigriseum]|uniref:Uncharacterized protein n=1 Tax=Planosporangium flavigriseum TaxID=373681 RepID=A0A8J3PNM3_9ACTN|nr:hypothetical protein [Planosporangium flavigriseum]NJC64679.1 hypothetical protein [Planosporangium flavigriseum]GIG74096.1 hypothetical protein Pfl04_25000 [Planosporangium flavigriseum]
MQQAAIPEEIAAAIQTWAANADERRFTDGPTLADLGGTTTVAESSAAIAASPWFLYLIDAAGKAGDPSDSTAGDDLQRIDTAIADGFKTHERPTSYASAVGRLLHYPRLAKRLDRRLERALFARAEDAFAPAAPARAVAIGASALEALVHLITTRVYKQHRLLTFFGDLLETIDTAPGEFKRRLPRLVGILHEHFAENDLITLLQQLARDPAADHDAGFELALADLRLTLDAEDFPTVFDGLTRARRGFAALTTAQEQRHDAEAYAAAIDAIVAFNRGDVAPVQEASTRLGQAVSQHAAWLAGCYSPPWMTNRREEEHAWQRLSVFLAAAAEPLSDDAWYRVDEAIGALLDAYRASRTFPRRFGGDDISSAGVEELIAPVIEATFADNARNLSLLDRALAEDPRFRQDAVARQLSEAVHAAVATAHGPPTGAPRGDVLGKDLRRVPAILRHFRADHALALLDRLSPELVQELENKLYDAKIARAETGNPKVEALLDGLERHLATSPDWSLAGGPFMVLVRQTVRFLMRCYNITARTGGARTAYLHVAATGDIPKECALQSDYLDWLKDDAFYNAIRAEVHDIAGGRADVVVELPGMSFYVECKREETNASRDGLHRYAGQARAYSVTNVAFGILLVLDLTKHRTGVPDLFSSVWLESVQVNAEETPRQIVVVRVPGNRPDPSATRTPARISDAAGVPQ